MIDLWNRLLEDGYRTGTAVLVASVAVVFMVNLGTWLPARIVVGVGAFAIGWFGYNTASGQTTPLYGDDARLWDVATQDGRGFMVVSLVLGVSAVVLWRFQLNIASRLLLLFGALFGASTLYAALTAGVDTWQANVGS